MSRQSFIACIALLVGVVAFASSFARPSPGQGAATSSAEGRYRLALAGANSTDVYVLDTVTGHAWFRPGTTTAPWIDLGVPPGAK